MFTVLYIAVVLVQLSLGQEFDYELDTTQNEDEEEATFISYIKPNSVDGNVLEIADEIPVCKDNFEAGDPKGPDNEQEEITIAAYNAGCKESYRESSDEEIASEEPCVYEAVPNKIIRISSPVKSDGKVTIIAHFGCEDDFNKNHTFDDDIKSEHSGENVNEQIPISFGGPVKAQGTVSIAAHFNCRENGKNIGTSHEITDEEIPDGFVSFGGPVHAQGKVSVGTHFGCGAPVGIPPIFPQMPWFSAYPYPEYYCPYPYLIPRSFQTPNPFSIPETGPFISSSIEHTDTQHWNLEDSQGYLPIASSMANSNNVCEEDFLLGNMSFNGVVPACGTVKIAARF